MPRYVIETALIVAIAVIVLIQSLSEDFESSAAILGIFLSGGLRLTASLLPLQSALLNIKQAIPFAVLTFNLLDSPEYPTTTSPPTAIASDIRKPSSLSIRNLGFTYLGNETKTLSGVSIDVHPGSLVAIIGTSGSGKSTLADLILGLLQPTEGTVEIDGEPPTSFSERGRSSLGYVPQKPGLVSGSIEQNIALGVEENDVDHNKLSESIKDSYLQDLIESLPQGLKTQVGNRKDELSGGQIQRIGLARALYFQPSLLVMDEATSALDAESENQINIALARMRGKVTVILIAHRLNTVQRADVVFLIEDGKVQDSGTFPELLKSNAKVRNLARLMSVETSDHPEGRSLERDDRGEF
jgi:ATP-binding cassette subfamily C protein